MRATNPNPANSHQPHLKLDLKRPFLEHVHELRKRLYYIAVSVASFTLAGYFIQQQIIAWLLKPSHGQQFIYTTPGGGLNFLFQVCLYFGIALSIPVIVYQVVRYLEPLLASHTKRLIFHYSFYSVVLAIAGGAFGYYLGLPLLLHFLSHQFTSVQIRPLLTIQEYMSFITVYLLGSVLLFQLPLIISFINRIKPLRPRRLLSFERYVIAFAFIASAIMAPTTDILNMLFFALPILVMYQLSVLAVYLRNRRHGESRVEVIAAQETVIPPTTENVILKPDITLRPTPLAWDIVRPVQQS